METEANGKRQTAGATLRISMPLLRGDGGFGLRVAEDSEGVVTDFQRIFQGADFC